jgi:ADP-ribose pyrophosphatase YjhB (NUDIX family)
MKYCTHCGSDLTLTIPPGDSRARHVCSGCGTVHYLNPKIVSGCIPEWEGRILLCRRSIEPRAGRWTLPAGFMELGETTAQAAARETLEEANARVELGELYALMNLPHIDQVYLMYRARLLDLGFSPGDESEEVSLFAPEAIPWDELAFPTIRHTLRFFVEDLRSGSFRLRIGEIVREGNGFGFRPEARNAAG